MQFLCFKEWYTKETLLQRIKEFILGLDEHVPEYAYKKAIAEFSDDIMDLETPQMQKWVTDQVRSYCDRFVGDTLNTIIGRQDSYYGDDWR